MKNIFSVRWVRKVLTLMLAFVVAGAFIPLAGGQVYAASKTHLISTLMSTIIQANPNPSDLVEGHHDTTYKIKVGDKIKNDTDDDVRIFIDSKEYHDTSDGAYGELLLSPGKTETITREYSVSEDSLHSGKIKTTDFWYLYGDFDEYQDGIVFPDICFFCPVSNEDADTVFTANIDKSKLSGGTDTLSKTSGIFVTDTVTLTVTPTAGSQFEKAPVVSLKNGNATLGTLVKTQNGAYTCTISEFEGNETVIVSASVATDESPQTGDATNLYGLLAILLAAGTTCGVICRRKAQQ